MKKDLNTNMKKRLRILVPGTLLFLLIAFLILGYILPTMKDGLINEKRSKIKGIVDVTVASLDRLNKFYKEGKYTLLEAQKLGVELVKNSRFGVENKDYLWINDFHPKMVMHPFKPALNGKDVSNVADPKGKRLFMDMVKVCRENGSGYVDYMWQYYKSSVEEIKPKISYVKSFKPWDWIVGTGLYIEDIEKEVGKIENRIILMLLFAMCIFIFFIVLMTKQVVKSTKATIDSSIAFIKQINEPLFVVNSDLVVQYINPQALKMLGYKEEEVLDKLKCHEICRYPICKSDKCTIKRSMSEHKSVIEQTVATTRNNKLIPVRASCNTIYDDEGNQIGGFEIIAEVKHLDQGFLNNMADPAFRTDVDLVIQNINEAALKALGYTGEEVIGKMTCADICKTPVCNTSNCTIKNCMVNKDTIIAETYATTKSGKKIPVRAACGCLTDAQGNVTGGFEVISDNSDFIKMVDTTSKIAEGDLTVEVDSAVLKRDDAVGNLAKSISRMVTDLRQIISNIVMASKHLSQAVNEISAGNENLAQRTNVQAASIEEIAATIEEATSSITQNSEHFLEVNSMAGDSLRLAEDGGEVVQGSIKAIQEIDESSKKISEIIDVINEIAFQTNLLALNAAVEAARAGEHGHGFAVVASEVRKLAHRAGEAAKEIKELIDDSKDKVSNGTELSNESGESLKGIIQGINQVSEYISEISAASDEQKKGMLQISTAVSDMESLTQQNAALVEETASASEEMTAQAKELMHLVQRFRI